MSFTLAWNGTVDFVAAEAAELAGAFEAVFFALAADTFFTLAARRVCVGTVFSLT
jgi:hypothetical protein